MTTLLDQAGYEQTKSKLQSLESRLAAMQDRSDLQAGHKQRVLASYQAMRKQYLEELRLFEAVQARGR